MIHIFYFVLFCFDAVFLPVFGIFLKVEQAVREDILFHNSVSCAMSVYILPIMSYHIM